MSLLTAFLQALGNFFRGMLGDVRKENEIRRGAVAEKNQAELQDALDKAEQVRETERQVRDASDDELDDGMRPPSTRGSNGDNR